MMAFVVCILAPPLFYIGCFIALIISIHRRRMRQLPKVLLPALLLAASPAWAQNGTPTFDSVITTGPVNAGGLITGASLSVGGTGPITGFGTAIGQAPVFINWSGSGFPGLHLSSRLIIDRGTTSPTDFTDFDLRRTTTFTSAAAGINAMLRITADYGAGDATHNWPLAVVAVTRGSNGGLLVGADFQSTRALGATNAIWGSLSEARDQSDLASSANGGKGVLGQEVDLSANGLDDAPNSASFGSFGERNVVQFNIKREDATNLAPTEIAHGIWFGQGQGAGTDTLAWVDSGIAWGNNSQIIQGLDMRGAIAPASYAFPVAAVRVSAGQIGIDFNGGASLTSPPGDYFAWDAATSKLKFYVAGVAKWSVDTSGNVRAAGTLTGSVTP
jgi:hypothetical protein